MSKIQKALQALKISQGDQASKGDEELVGRRINAPDPVRKRAGSSDLTGDNGRLKSFEACDESTPNHDVEISLESLEKAGLLPCEEDRDVIAQQFRRIKRPILQAAFEVDLRTGDNANVIMMASALPGAGKSFCAFNLAQSIALDRDFGAVLVDADVLKPGISRCLGLQDHIGFIDYLVDPSIPLEDILVQTNLNGVVVIPAGQKHPEATELLSSRRMRELVSLLSIQYKSRAVIFDTPPLLITSEAQVLAAQAGQIVVVIEARVSTQESVMRAVDLLDRQKPVNAILNKSRNAVGSGYQSDDYGYYPYTASARRDADNA